MIEKIIKKGDYIMKDAESIRNTNITRHSGICGELNRMYARKNEAYGDSFHASFLEDGLVMSKIRLGDKFNRFKTLSTNPNVAINDESIIDTLMDLANYSIMTIMELQDREDKDF